MGLKNSAVACQIVVVEILCHGDEDAVFRSGGGGALVGEEGLLL